MCKYPKYKKSIDKVSKIIYIYYVNNKTRGNNELIRGVNKPNGKLDQVVKCLMNMDICKQNFYIISIDNCISFYYIYYVNKKTIKQ